MQAVVEVEPTSTRKERHMEAVLEYSGRNKDGYAAFLREEGGIVLFLSMAEWQAAGYPAVVQITPWDSDWVDLLVDTSDADRADSASQKEEESSTPPKWSCREHGVDHQEDISPRTLLRDITYEGEPILNLISTRAVKGLDYMGVKTVRGLRDGVRDGTLRGAKGVGRRTFKELQELAEYL